MGEEAWWTITTWGVLEGAGSTAHLADARLARSGCRSSSGAATPGKGGSGPLRAYAPVFSYGLNQQQMARIDFSKGGKFV